MGTDNLPQTVSDGPPRESSPVHSQRSSCSLDKEAGMATCRVCQCAESDKRGDVALDFLGITPPLPEPDQNGESLKPETTKASTDNASRDSGLVEFISPQGEVFICSMDLEMGQFHQQHSLLELGCSCKSDLALVHYACALKWFVSHGSTVCEICGQCATNIRTADVKKVVLALKDYETLRERTVIGHLTPSEVATDSSVDPDAIAAIRRQRLSEISLWFSTHRHSVYNNSSAVSQVGSEQPVTVTEDNVPSEHPATKWAVEGTGILLATGLLTVTLAWLIAPRVGKKTARNGLHILLGGVCALAVVIFFRFFVLTRIRYGPSRYWAILFVFWFLVFGIWASRTHGAHTTT